MCSMLNFHYTSSCFSLTVDDNHETSIHLNERKLDVYWLKLYKRGAKNTRVTVQLINQK